MSPTLNPAALLWASLLAVPLWCHACATVSAEPEDSIRVTDETALIVWNAQTKTEHFVRHANFQTAAKYFGFLVPTPSKPQLGAASNELFLTLQRELLPKTKIETQYGVNFTPFFYTSGSGEDESAATANAAAPSEEEGATRSIDVVEQTRVGDYDASVLWAKDPVALTNWLTQHHYAVADETRAWLEPYVQQGYFITAFQIAADRSSQTAQAQPVRLSFQANEPFYPYREPNQSQKNNASRSLRVFFVGDTRVDGRIQDGSKTGRWPATVSYSAPLEGDNLGKNDFSMPAGNLHLTVFDDYSSPRPGWGDLHFALSEDQSEITPPPHIIREHRQIPLPVDILVVGGFVAICLWPKARKRSPI